MLPAGVQTRDGQRRELEAKVSNRLDNAARRFPQLAKDWRKGNSSDNSRMSTALRNWCGEFRSF